MEIEIKNSTAISLVIIVALLATTGYLLTQVYLPKTGYSVASSNTPATNSLNVFEGRITGATVKVGSLEGTTTYDANCVGGSQGQTQCDAGISTSEYGVVNFHYAHNMAIQPCLHMFGPEKVTVDILDSSGNAKITRTIDVTGMGHMS